MSKLRDRIRDITRRAPAPFGFAAMRTTTTTSSRQILVAAEADSATDAGRAADAGADVIVFTGALSHLAEAVAAAPKAVVGARIDAATPQDVAGIREAGGAFLVCTDDGTDARALLDQNVGYVIAAPTTVTPALSDEDHPARLRSFRGLDLDGVLINGLPETMTVRQQLQVRRLGELARKPLFVRVSAPVGADTLELWRDSGVAAVVGSASTAAELATAADAVPAPRKPQQERADAIIPAAASSSDDEEEDE
jgi:hypothetical protein